MEISPNSAAATAAATAAAPASSSTSSPSAPKRLTTTLRILCPSSRASALRGASRDLHVDQPPVGDEAVLSISGPDAPAVAVRAWERVVGHRVGGDEAAGEEEREVPGVVGCRMLAASGQVGCVLGKGGKTVERMRQESGAQIRVFRNRDQLPPWAAPVDELIHVRISTQLTDISSFLCYIHLIIPPDIAWVDYSSQFFGAPGVFIR